MGLELLIDRLAKHKKLRSLLGGASHLPAEILVESLLREFEYVIDRYSSWSAYAEEAHKDAATTLSGHSLDKHRTHFHIEEDSADHSPLRIKPIKIMLPAIDIQETEKRIAVKRADEVSKKRIRRQLEEVEHLIQSEVGKDWDGKAADVETHAQQLRTSQQILRNQTATVKVQESEPVESVAVLPPPDFSEDDLLYIHCATLAEQSSPLVTPLDHMKGFDGTGPMYSFHSGNTKLFVSIVRREELNVTRSGMLLLNKEDSLHYREVHEVILNGLRNEEIILPFEFGSLVRGKEELVRLAGSLSPVLHSGIEADAQAGSWSVKLFALDARVSRTIAELHPVRRPQERGQDAKRPLKRSDIKTLEKLLQHERTMAESVHAILTGVSTTSEIASLVNIGNGTTEDWKLILDASYTIPVINRSKFFFTVLELQKEHLKAGLMFEVHGPSGRCSVTASARTSHATPA